MVLSKDDDKTGAFLLLSFFIYFFFAGLQRPHFILKTNNLEEQALK